MAFLTLIAPLIAFTYPIDKVKDGTAQAFNKWLIEYTFNALMQPIHLLIYVVLVGSATSLMSSNPIYAIVALAFINKAEKLIKDMFGLNKASTPPSPGGSLLAANAIQSGYNRLRNGSGGGGSLPSGKSGGNGGSSNNSKIRQKRGMEAYGNNNSNSSRNGSSESGQNNNPRISSTPEEGTQSNNPITSSRPEGGNTGADIPEGGNTGARMPDSREDPTRTINSSSENGSRDRTGSHTSLPQTTQNPTARRTLRNPVRSTLRAGRKSLGRNLVKAAKYTGKKLGKGAIRTAAFAAAAAPMLAVGAMAYAVSGDTKYLKMGAGAAYALSGRITDKISKAPKAIRTAYRKERLGSGGAEKKARYEEFIKDKDNLKQFREYNPNLGLKNDRDTLKYLKENNADKYISAGYNNAEDVSRLMDMEKKMEGKMTADQIMTADQMASSSDVQKALMDDEASVKLQDRLAKEIEARGVSGTQAKKDAHNHMNAMRISLGQSKVSEQDVQNTRDRITAREEARENERAQAQEQLELLRQLTAGGGTSRGRRNASSTNGGRRNASSTNGGRRNASSTNGGRRNGSSTNGGRRNSSRRN